MAAKTSVKPLLAGVLTFLILEAVALMLMANDSIVQKIRIEGAVAYLGEKLYNFRSGITYYFSLREINDQLSKENTRLLNQLSYYRTLTENRDSAFVHRDDSSGRAEKGENSDFYYIPAKIVGMSTNRLHNYLIINKGSKDGIKEDMGVISSEGVAGVIRSVSDNYAYVISLLNVSQAVSAKIVSSGAYGPLTWDGRSAQTAILSEIPQHIPVMTGDTVATSGLSTIFPPDIPLGRIRKSKIVMGSHHQIEVRLFQDFRTLHFVNVVVNRNKEELDKLTQEYEK
ncbi:MAG: rod shape-determining protein MreC [Bacteroidales bacterium]|nr:rod shape-determining protein MreC [Bacteroidales bacterium]MDD2425117.1 rod shape-determining protein MreC [Bacteroidales bacterium]MDD3989462.1 rod shape-determining protein MreC [Bacteroidales bacterium]MDD4638490.1 rod shape-determining protein MreC [Bacteroidales bacterium]